ncbi:MAG: DHH family phosphoesterase [Candidatus Thermoplasmatota archaeon]
MFNKAREIADIIKRSSEVHIVTHIDADGIAAGAIAIETLRNLDKNYSIECVKQLDDTVIDRLKNEEYELIWFTDLGSSINLTYKELPRIVTDHHSCSKTDNDFFNFNPHLHGLDGSLEISGAGATYIVSKVIDNKNERLSPLAIVGACGDLQDRRYCKLTGFNLEIIKDAERNNLLEVRKDIRYFGRESRPIIKLLQYANDPLIPGLTGREEACASFLHELDVPLKVDDKWRRWIDLNMDEKQRITSSIARLLLSKGFGYRYVSRLIGEVYLLSMEEPGIETHDAREYATLLNATARYGKHEIGLKVCLGDRDSAFKKARSLLRSHRQNLVEGLQFAKDEKLGKKRNLQFFHAGDGIRDTIIGIVTNMMLQSEYVDKNLPLIGIVYTDTGDVKVSARGTQEMIDRGLDLSLALRLAAKKVNGIGGGHNIAAGATIPKGTENEFLDALDDILEKQFKR